MYTSELSFFFFFFSFFSFFSKVCSLCGYKSGACIQCKAKGCTAAFHVTCAQANNLYMDIHDRNGVDPVMTAYCRKHSDHVCNRFVFMM